MTISINLKALILKLVTNKKVSWLLTIVICIVVIILYRNLGKFLLTDRLIKGSPFVAGIGYKESHLPDEVISMKILTSNAQVTDFRMSPLEFLYPIRENPQSKFLFAVGEEQVEARCVEKGRENRVVLYYCE
jgi:hypothetical protein